jgi:hypothetical protein
MKHETGKLTMRKTIDGVEKVVIIDAITKPFTWAVETLKKLILENNAESKDEIFKLRERMKDNLKNVKISKCSFDLGKCYERFDKAVTAAQNVGCDLSENYLRELFAEGCVEHRDLKGRAAIVHAELRSVKTCFDLKMVYAGLIKPKMERKVIQEDGKNHFVKQKPKC